MARTSAFEVRVRSCIGPCSPPSHRRGSGPFGVVEVDLSNESMNALVTGAGSGIGRATAVGLAKLGLRVALVGRDAEKLEGTRKLVAAENTLVEPCDVADRAGVAAMAGRVLAEFGGSIDVLVCNAGTNVRDRSLEKLSLDDWDRMIDTNLTGAFHLVHAFLPAMRSRGKGLIVQVCSIAGLRASLLGGAGYSASKFGQAALGIGIGREEGPRGIRSSVIYPGEVNTPILDARPVPVPQERKDAILQAEDVAAAVCFLVQLPPRAHIPELVIKPTVDDWC
jgi:NADP-dependent 3-hydroxy acid dehydrogenase YdfG